jgi:hypothetical protein
VLRRVPPSKHVEEPRLRAVTPAYRMQALRRAGTGFSPWRAPPILLFGIVNIISIKRSSFGLYTLNF